MWQRKQSVFLLVAAMLAFATWLFPVATYEVGERTFEFWTTGLYVDGGAEFTDRALKIPFSIILSVLGAAMLVTIALYRNRPRQMRFVRGTYLLVLGVIAFLFITDNSMQAYLEGIGEVDSNYGPSFFMPMIILPLAFMAERAIRSDEELVRSTDRLR
ncbi:MAG: DUF4293 domain-containing protein [Flavobacteriales bacterium]|nr:DUF4293 domain-containing protein [Flavobacteriales bacterium]